MNQCVSLDQEGGLGRLNHQGFVSIYRLEFDSCGGRRGNVVRCFVGCLFEPWRHGGSSSV